jgi:hypothetical protein
LGIGNWELRIGKGRYCGEIEMMYVGVLKLMMYVGVLKLQL